MSDFGISSRFELAVVDYTAEKFPVLIRPKLGPLHGRQYWRKCLNIFYLGVNLSDFDT